MKLPVGNRVAARNNASKGGKLVAFPMKQNNNEESTSMLIFYERHLSIKKVLSENEEKIDGI